MRALQEGTLEKVVASMVPAFPRGKISHVSTFMAIHPAFSRAQQILDQLFTGELPPPSGDSAHCQPGVLKMSLHLSEPRLLL